MNDLYGQLIIPTTISISKTIAKLPIGAILTKRTDIYARKIPMSYNKPGWDPSVCKHLPVEANIQFLSAGSNTLCWTKLLNRLEIVINKTEREVKIFHNSKLFLR